MKLLRAGIVLLVLCLLGGCYLGTDVDNLREKVRQGLSYTVTFNSNGGSGVPDQTVKYGGRATRPTNPTRSSYAFDNWYSDADLTTVYSFSTRVTGNITLYANWNITYTVAYDKNAIDAAGTMTNSSHTYDVDKSLNANAFTRTGYTFDGWAETPDGAIKYADNENVKNLTDVAGDTVTLYAVWTPNTAGITLDIEQIIDNASIIADITISRTNEGYPVTYTVSVDASDYDAGSINWEVAGVGAYADQTVTGSGGSFTLDATEVKYNSLGIHALTLTVTKGGQQYQKAIPFTIVP